MQHTNVQCEHIGIGFKIYIETMNCASVLYTYVGWGHRLQSAMYAYSYSRSRSVNAFRSIITYMENNRKIKCDQPALGFIHINFVLSVKRICGALRMVHHSLQIQFHFNLYQMNRQLLIASRITHNGFLNLLKWNIINRWSWLNVKSNVIAFSFSNSFVRNTYG